VSGRRQVLLRVDPAVHDALTRWANDEFRSVNAHVEMLLRRALTTPAGCLNTPRPYPSVDDCGAPASDEAEQGGWGSHEHQTGQDSRSAGHRAPASVTATNRTRVDITHHGCAPTRPSHR
jgi:hypothetical protein